ncbi:MAG: hypothetical protein AMXMBFR25_18440 [Lysobacterales bacterium]
MALDPDKAFRHYVHDRWTIEDGLPQLSVLAIAQDATGYLWLTTQNGVARFDGVRFRIYNVENTPALRANIIDKVHLGSDGSLWFASSRGLTRMREGVWTGIELAPDRDVVVSAFANDIDGRLLVGTDDGLYRVDDAGAMRIALAGTAIMALARSGSAVYAASNGAVHELRGETVRVHRLPGADAAPTATSLWAAPEGLYAGTRRGLYRLVDGRWETPDWARAIDQSRIESLFRDGDGNLWIGSTEGAWRHHPRRGLERCLSANLPATAWISAFYEDRENNLWIGSLTHSLTRVWNGWVARINAEDGLTDPFVWSVLGDDQGRLWIGSNSGIEVLEPGGRVRPVVSTRELPDSSVYNLFRTRAGDLLVGTRAGLARWDGRHLRRDRIHDPLGNVAIRAIVEEDPQHFWIGTSDGLYEQTGEGLELHGTERGLKEPHIRALAQTQRGELWVGTERGLYRGVDGRYRRIDQPPELAPALVTTILPWRDQKLLIGTMDAGLFVGTLGTLRQATTAHGLPYNSAFALAADNAWIYVTSPEGVYRIASGELERFHAEGGRLVGDMIVQTGNRHAGALRTRCCNGGAQARIARLDGELWLPTLDGVLRLDTARVRRSNLSPPVVAETLEHLNTTREGGGPFVLDGRSGDIAISYAGLALQDPTGLRFRYRLVGYDERWRLAGDRRTVYYTNLAPGSYRFEVIATSSAGLDSPHPATITFRLVPPFYRASWFRILLALLGCVLMALGWQAYRRRLRAREGALEELVRRRTAELDRANERLRAANRALVEESHTDALTGLRNRRFLAHHMANWRRATGDSRPQRLALVLLDLDHFKRVNDLHGHLAGDEVLRQLAGVLNRVAGEHGIALRWGGEEFMLVMPAESIVDATQFCERLRAEVSAHEFVHATGARTRLTASIGYALFPALADKSDAEDWNLALELADAALYLVKTGGRNGWAIVHARAHAGIADLSGVGGRLRELALAGLLLIETDNRQRLRGAALAQIGDTH